MAYTKKIKQFSQCINPLCGKRFLRYRLGHYSCSDACRDAIKNESNRLARKNKGYDGSTEYLNTKILAAFKLIQGYAKYGELSQGNFDFSLCHEVEGDKEGFNDYICGKYILKEIERNYFNIL